MNAEEREEALAAVRHTGTQRQLVKLVEQWIAEAQAEALREAARFFEYDMAPAWGGDTRWISTGSHVADLVASVLRERAADADGGAA